MGLLSRMSLIVRAKLNELLGAVEDPQQVLDYSYEKQAEMLQQVKRGVVEVATARRRLELQAARQREDAARLEDQARRALQAGREDLARAALERKQLALSQLQDLQAQIDNLQQEQERLALAESRLSAKLEAFRTRKELIKARYSSAEAQVRIGEAVTGLSEEMADVGLAIERAEEKTEQLEARAAAIDQLVSEGVLEDVTAGRDSVERELRRLQLAENVDRDLAALKRELGQPDPKALGEGR